MDIVVTIEDGQPDELRRIETAVRDELQEQGVQVDRAVTEVEQGALGALEVLQFVGENVMLPVLVQALYDYVVKRLREPDGDALKIHAARTDLPDGTRRCELTVEGEAKEVAAALEELL
ncbi:hypothetical protein LWP59_18465 [Amycolatopsis acidiphila]|uniref:Uncharacterized protein n=1 Tax=Amycolatopsis acidiphila TaxID=715473 RepID=A0A558A6W0_9PSEU|nr:hypothetical protein [Amycolatopsis acidiphila]TVT20005.1 hypothetical protein FNH06_22050 [Amycolatopsis acidiphila]UIJ63468.1 hypothetical protein LWP59_18465 [Amycolatopsis acidiphila]GHG68754.1 hypothetical protein GCM10017788_28780 [Amycolatopsis acidiphila]